MKVELLCDMHIDIVSNYMKTCDLFNHSMYSLLFTVLQEIIFTMKCWYFSAELLTTSNGRFPPTRKKEEMKKKGEVV